MPKDSCIEHKKSYYIQLRRDYLELLGGDQCAALLLAVLEFQTNGEANRDDIRDRVREPWITVSLSGLARHLLALYSDRWVKKRIRFLEQSGLLTVERYPGQLNRYLLNCAFITEALKDKLIFKPGFGDDQGSEFTSEVSSPVTREVSSPVGGDYNKEEELEEKEPIPPPPFPSRNAPIEERLDPDVVSDIQELYVVEETPPERSAKSKTQMSSQEQRRFWNHWRRRTGLKPDVIERARYQRWLSYRALDDAITAVNGYTYTADGKPGLDAFSLQNFQQCYTQSLAAERYREKMAQERAINDSLATPPASTTPTPAASPTSPWCSGMAVNAWNEMVPSNPVDWDWLRDDSKDLDKAVNDPVFEQRFPEICAKAEALAQGGRLDRDFRWMIKSYGKKAGNWWEFLNEKERPKAKPSIEETMRKIVEDYGK